MGVLDKFCDAFKRKSIEEQTREDVRQKINNFREKAKAGASKEELLEILEKPSDFNECIGDLLELTPRSVAMMITKLDQGDGAVDPKTYSEAMKNWEISQNRCNDFFRSSAMTYYIMARAMKREWKSSGWDFVDKFFSLFDDDYWQAYRKEEWWRAVWAFKLRDEVELLKGPGSCTSQELFKAWESYSSDEIIDFLKDLDPKTVAKFRCVD